MKKLYLICCLCLLLGASCSKDEPEEISDDTVVPFADPNFEKLCLERLDENKDGRITVGEVAYLKEFWLTPLDIVSLAGIEYFTSLEKLSCNGVSLPGGTLEQLDVSHNLHLVELQCADNKLRSLDVSHNKALVKLVCGGNMLTNLDLSENQDLSDLFCENNQLSELDLRKSPALRTAYCERNIPGMRLKINWMQTPNINCDKTAEIEVEGDEVLVFKSALFQEFLSDFDQNGDGKISRHEALYITNLTLWGDEIPALDDCSYLPNLVYFEIRSTDRTKCYATSLDGLKNCPKLWRLTVQNIPVSNIDLSAWPELHDLWCVGTDVESLDISGNANLGILDCLYSPLLKEVWMKNRAQKERMRLQLEWHTTIKFKEGN